MYQEQIFILGNDSSVQKMRMRFLSEGFGVRLFAEIDILLAHINTHPPDLLLLVGHSGEDNGVRLCVQLRSKSNAPIILTGQNLDDYDIISALSGGADACFREPFGTGVLIAQIHALFRRSKQVNTNDSLLTGYLVDEPDLKIDLKSRSVIVQYVPIDLTAMEFDILSLLASHPNQVFYTNQIFQTIWDTDSILNGDDRTVSVHISNLRKKIEPDPLHPRYIVTIRGVGYKFQVQS